MAVHEPAAGAAARFPGGKNRSVFEVHAEYQLLGSRDVEGVDEFVVVEFIIEVAFGIQDSNRLK
jgi:hypothetical protein